MSCYDTVEPLNNGHVEDENFVHCSEVVLSSEVATVKMNECLCVCVCVCVGLGGGGGGGGCSNTQLPQKHFMGVLSTTPEFGNTIRETERKD